MTEHFNRAVLQRVESIEKSQWHLRDLSTMNVQGKRGYLQTLLLILFVASAFAISISDYAPNWGVYLSVSMYLLCAVGICLYLPILLTREGSTLDKIMIFMNQQQNALVNALENGDVKDLKSFEKFREKKHGDEKIFRANLPNDPSDNWFLLINAFFLLGTLVLPISYALEQYCSK